ncbi:hypothetical protein FIP36_16975 [Salmonella enterica]|nr:hypothetical protein [Salmonella enterica]
MKGPLLFTYDFHLVPASVPVNQGPDGNYFAMILRECPECEGRMVIDGAECVTCHGEGTVGPCNERLVEVDNTSIYDPIKEFRHNPALNAWKLRHADRLQLLKADTSKFGLSIQQHLDEGRFLTTRQLESFLKTYQPVKKAITAAIPEPEKHKFELGDNVNLKISFTEVRAAYSKVANRLFFTFTGMTNLGGFAVTANSQDYILLGQNYMLSGKVRKFYTFDSSPYAILTVHQLNLYDH